MEFFQEFRHSDSLIFVDPAMADGGRLYAGFGPEFPQAMARVCAQADIIVPNPVSYTHLDVYKRQGVGSGIPKPR